VSREFDVVDRDLLRHAERLCADAQRFEV